MDGKRLARGVLIAAVSVIAGAGLALVGLVWWFARSTAEYR
jgi:hypothetical protein